MAQLSPPKSWSRDLEPNPNGLSTGADHAIYPAMAPDPVSHRDSAPPRTLHSYMRLNAKNSEVKFERKKRYDSNHQGGADGWKKEPER